MKVFFSILAFILLINNANAGVSPGTWSGFLQLNTATVLPFLMTAGEENSNNEFQLISIFNGEERINLHGQKTSSDSIDYVFPNFNSFIRIHINSKTEMNGVWYNKAKGDHYKIPFKANFKTEKDELVRVPNNLSGNWATVFEPNSESGEPALGVFDQTGNILTGTFLTETGDYRFLAGETDGKIFELSCFDGSHAFLFTGKLTAANDSIHGHFYSGNHWESDWIAIKNKPSQLRDPDSITFVVNNLPVIFDLKDIYGKDYHYPNADTKDKVVIIQIMGTWCPNCLDETIFFKQMYDKYHSKGLEIISIGYETSKTNEGRIESISKLKQRHNLDFTFLVGGCADKQVAQEKFNMLNEIVSFPTTLFIDKTGKVVLIHTGFSGPGTGEYYTKYTEKTEKLIKELLDK